jgi:hypothetical protein
MGGGGAVADVIRLCDETGLCEKLAVAESLRALVGRDEQVFAPAGAFEPALAAQRLDDVVDGFGTSAEQFNSLLARDASQAALAEGKHDRLSWGTRTGRETPSYSPSRNPLRESNYSGVLTARKLLIL